MTWSLNSRWPRYHIPKTATQETGGRIGGGVASPSRSRLAPHLGLGKEGDEVEVDGGLLPRRLPTAALPLPPHPSPWKGLGPRSATKGLLFPPTHRFFSGSVRFLPGDVSGAGGDAVARWILWAGREKFLDFFFLNQLFVSGTGAKLDTTDAAWPETFLRPSPAATPCPGWAFCIWRVLGLVG